MKIKINKTLISNYLLAFLIFISVFFIRTITEEYGYKIDNSILRLGNKDIVFSEYFNKTVLSSEGYLNLFVRLNSKYLPVLLVIVFYFVSKSLFSNIENRIENRFSTTSKKNKITKSKTFKKRTNKRIVNYDISKTKNSKYFDKYELQNSVVAFISSLLLIFSPVFLFLSTSLNAYLFPLFLLFLGIFLVLNNKHYAALFFFVFSSLFDFSFLVVSLIFIAYSIFKNHNVLYTFCFMLFVFSLFFLIFSGYLNIEMSYFPLLNSSEILFEFSNNLSIPFVIFLLGSIGLSFRGYNKTFSVIESLFIVSIVLTLFIGVYSSYVLVVSYLLVALFAGFGTYMLLFHSFKIRYLKVFIILMLLSLLIQTEITALNRLSLNEHMNVLNFIEFNDFFEEFKDSALFDNKNKLILPFEYNCFVKEYEKVNGFFDEGLCSGLYQQKYPIIFKVLNNEFIENEEASFLGSFNDNVFNTIENESVKYFEKLRKDEFLNNSLKSVSKEKSSNSFFIDYDLINFDEFEQFMIFFNLTSLREFNKFISDNNLSGIIVTPNFEEYIEKNNPVLLSILKTFDRIYIKEDISLFVFYFDNVAQS